VLVFLSVFVSVQIKLVYLCDGRIVLLVTFLDLWSGMDCPKTSFRHGHFQVFGADL